MSEKSSPLNSEGWKTLVSQVPQPILVVGAAGFIGARLTELLYRHGGNPVAGTRNNNRAWRLKNLTDLHHVELDVLDPNSIKKTFNKIKPKTVFYLSSYGNSSWHQDFNQIYSVNVLGLRNVLEVVKDNGLASFVHAGSSSEYGTNCSGVSEGDLLEPNSDY